MKEKRRKERMKDNRKIKPRRRIKGEENEQDEYKKKTREKWKIKYEK